MKGSYFLLLDGCVYANVCVQACDHTLSSFTHSLNVLKLLCNGDECGHLFICLLLHLDFMAGNCQIELTFVINEVSESLSEMCIIVSCFRVHRSRRIMKPTIV